MAANYKKQAQADIPDIRDRIYQPALVQLVQKIDAPDSLYILDQGTEGACTGFALAGVINLLNQRAGRGVRVSARMLYEMAKRCDEWPGEDYDGSSLRGAIRGWKNMGVCSEEKWPHKKKARELTIERARDARNNTLGAYYRLRPVISDFHAALNEAGLIAVSAQVHKGWDDPTRKIKFYKTPDGGHAFVIVGYNDEGFWVQNSWGRSWGENGVALWTYEDWVRNVMDAWVVRLAVPTPQIFGEEPRNAFVAAEAADPQTKASTDRHKIAGHFVHIDDGKFKESGKYWSTPGDVEQTARLVAESTDYDHVMFYAHGGLNSPKSSAARIAALKDGFKRNRIYPFHIMYDTGLVEELKDVILRKGQVSRERVGGFFDFSDRILEGLVRMPGTIVWDEMKSDAKVAFDKQGAGTQSLKFFLRHLGESKKKKAVHFVGHSTGGVLIAHLLQALKSHELKVENCFLMAPACSVKLYNSHYVPVLEGKTPLKIGTVLIYNLTNQLEEDDNVVDIYRKSLLYLVSNAFEHDKKEPILGMQIFEDKLGGGRRKTVFHYSNGVSGNVTRSKSHGGFDNDVVTMNHVLTTILRKKPKAPFTTDELCY